MVRNNRNFKLENNLNKYFQKYNSAIANFEIYNINKKDTINSYFLINFTINNTFYHFDKKINASLQYIEIVAYIAKDILTFYKQLNKTDDEEEEEEFYDE